MAEILKIGWSKIKKHTQNSPALIVGTILLISSPVMALLIPSLLKKMTCAAIRGLESYGCDVTEFYTGAAIGILFFISGSLLMLIGLRIKKK